MSYGISDYVLRWCTVFSFFSHPLKLKALTTVKAFGDWNQTQNSGQTWNQNREKSHAEKPALWFYVTCVVLTFTPLFWTVESVSRWREKLSVKFTMHFTDVKLHAVCEVEFSLQHVCHWLLCHWDSFLHFFLLCLAFKVILNLKSNIRETERNRQWKRGVPQWNTLLYVELMLWITCSHTSLSPMYSLWFLYDVYCMWILAPNTGWPKPDIYHYYFCFDPKLAWFMFFLLSRGRTIIHHKTTTLPLRFKKMHIR